MLFNKERQTEYLGFNDFWFSLIGIIVVALIVDFILANSFMNESFGVAFVNYGISLFFSSINWVITREIIILLRRKFPELRESFKRIALIVFALLFTIFMVDLLGTSFLKYIFNNDFNPIQRSKLMVPIILVAIMIMAIYEAIYYYVKLKKSIRQEEESKRIIVQTQLDALRNQARPHFLFNSLNTLRDIIDQNPKEDAKLFLDKLSNVYRFILESGNENTITLKEELKFANSYIHIQSERFGDNLKVDWNIPTATLDLMVAPMSLQILLENAIKHNVISKSKPLSISVGIENNKLVVFNKIQAKSSKLPSTKVGLKNIEERYKLISSEKLIIENNDGVFKVSLPLLKIKDQKKRI